MRTARYHTHIVCILGVVVAMSQAVFDNDDTFLGIVGIEMKVADLLSEIIYDGSGSNSYFFVMVCEL